MNEEDTEEVPIQEPVLDESQESQINRMAGCARLGKWMVFLLLLGAAGFYFVPNKVMAPTPEMRSKSTMEDFSVALRTYRTEYNRFPISVLASGKDAELRSRGNVLTALTGQGDKLNPRKIKFVDLPAAKGQKQGLYQDQGEWLLVDPWGEMYYLALDTDVDNRVANPDPTDAKVTPFLGGGTLIYSAGPDRDPTTWGDNVCSWR